jgi:hypothetical protein
VFLGIVPLDRQSLVGSTQFEVGTIGMLHL